jgi:hypothetical protein
MTTQELLSLNPSPDHRLSLNMHLHNSLKCHNPLHHHTLEGSRHRNKKIAPPNNSSSFSSNSSISLIKTIKILIQGWHLCLQV